MSDNKFVKTGCQDIDISVGDSPQRIEDIYSSEDYLTEIVYSKDVGSFKQAVYNQVICLLNDDVHGRITESSEVYIHVETNDLYNYIHFEYEGGTGFTLRMPVKVSNA